MSYENGIAPITEKLKTQNSKLKFMYWILLIIAGLFEVAFTFCLGKGKETQGTTMYLWYGGFLLCTFVSMSLLMKVSQHLPLGTAYAVWTGIGAVGTALVGIFVFKEPASFWRLFFLSTLIGSVVGRAKQIHTMKANTAKQNPHMLMRQAKRSILKRVKNSR